MMNWELRIQNSLRKHVLGWAFCAVFLLGLIIRYTFLPLMVADMEFMNMGWYGAIKAGGMANALAPQYQWTYSPLHLYLWTLAAQLFPHANDMMVLKAVSLLMEAGLMAAAALLLWAALPAPKRRLGLFAGLSILWLSPILILNVAGWGQTDASYAALSVLSIWLLIRNRPSWSMVCFGFALAFKLQALFLLPALMIAYFCMEKKFSVLWFLLIPAVWVATGLPMALIGQSPLYAVSVYFQQTDLYTNATFNCPNLYALLGDALKSDRMIQGMWQRYGLVLAVASLGGMATWMIYRRKTLNPRQLLLLGAWCVLVCLFFLPRMHERYGMVGEVLLALWAASLWKPRGFFYVALGILPTVSAYCQYMFAKPIFSLQLGAALNLILLMLLTRETIVGAEEKQPLPVGDDLAA
ncbi:MAG TPA: glycosyltransferase 87 family protein [Candidatus Limiplasma sp.]|nr:glycosyltransferase 87 family protein [Candidatus Limiplasma sp.]HPS82503.1 glycosyltransferase 87 family protein [Candidatus Limiplasma sp.]